MRTRPPPPAHWGLLCNYMHTQLQDAVCLLCHIQPRPSPVRCDNFPFLKSQEQTNSNFATLEICFFAEAKRFGQDLGSCWNMKEPLKFKCSVQMMTWCFFLQKTSKDTWGKGEKAAGNRECSDIYSPKYEKAIKPKTSVWPEVYVQFSCLCCKDNMIKHN